MMDPAFEARSASLDARDRRWLQELVYGMLRRRAALDAVIAPRVTGGLARLDADVVDLLRLGADQLLHMNSVPRTRRSRRRWSSRSSAMAWARRGSRTRCCGESTASATRSASRRRPIPSRRSRCGESHPRWLVARWVARWGADETARLLASNNAEPPTVLRPYGVVREQLEASLEAAGAHTRECALVPGSLELVSGVALTELGAYRQGQFFVQDPGATLVTEYASIPAGARVADLCAAPGGKALELARSAAVVIACDRSPLRTPRLLQNAHRVGAANVLTVVADARFPAVGEVDAVLLDVPCSGTGTFRRHPDARWRLKPSDIAVMGALQRALIRSAAAVVRPGGLLIYSTCSLEPEENDAQIESFLADAAGAWTLEPPPAGAVPAEVLDAGRLRVLPHRHGVDGAFAARLRRTAA